MNDVCTDDKRPGVTSFLILVDTPLLVKSACLMPRGRYGDFPKFLQFWPKSRTESNLCRSSNRFD